MLLDSARVEKETTQAGKLSAVSFPSTGGAGVSTLTLGTASKLIPRRRSQGMPKGRGGRKLTLIIDVRGGLTKTA